MKTWIVSYADALFISSQERLVESAHQYSINEIRSWDRDWLERTSFYSLHQAILDLKRGAGYWLWKPFIIEETLKEMEDGDVVIYSDAGIEIIGDLSPLIDLCLQKRGILLFAGHYDDVGAPGPNQCYKWTKRDCFVLMGCDEARYYQGQMLDASFMVLAKTERSVAFIREWIHYCTQGQILTDLPNRCGLPNLAGFIEHRHDQSILSILAIREGVEFFRHPSQHGNHLKDEPYREPGEWTRKPYGADGIYFNSPYKTLLNHHRGALGQKDLTLHLSRRIRAGQQQVFEVWASAKNMKEWLVPPGYRALAADVDFCVGGKYRLTIMERSSEVEIDLEGEYIEICPPERLVYTWPWDMRVTVEFHNQGDCTEVALLHESFPSEKIRDLHATGWNLCLDRLANDFPASLPEWDAATGSG
jgi:uncharacterized protein YndB with AHSA1/START domain